MLRRGFSLLLLLWLCLAWCGGCAPGSGANASSGTSDPEAGETWSKPALRNFDHATEWHVAPVLHTTFPELTATSGSYHYADGAVYYLVLFCWPQEQGYRRVELHRYAPATGDATLWAGDKRVLAAGILSVDGTTVFLSMMEEGVWRLSSLDTVTGDLHMYEAATTDFALTVANGRAAWFEQQDEQ